MAEYDLVVIGGGIAGWTAARRAQSLGGSVALIERGTERHGASGSRRSGGRLHAAYLNPRKQTPDVLYARMLKKTEGTGRPETIRGWADNTARAVEFLVSQGAAFHALGPEEYLQTSLRDAPLAEDRRINAAAWEGRGPDVLLTTMWQAFLKDGGTFRPGERALALEMKDGAVVGVTVEKAGGDRELVRGRAVLMADGGFAANEKLMREHGVTRHSYQYGCSEYALGDCLRMATAIGAKTHNLDSFYGFITWTEVPTDLRLQRTPIHLLMDAGVLVNGTGERIGDEVFGDEEHSLIDWPLDNAVAKTGAPGDSWVIVDDAVWRAAVEDETPIKNLATAMATIAELQTEQSRIRRRAKALRGGAPRRTESITAGHVTAATIGELARKTGIPAAALERTLAGFNRYVAEGGAIEPPRSGRPEPVSQAPFHAVALRPGIFFTEGGVLVNGSAEVLDESERPIPGLYAAGNTAGGLQGGPHNAYAGGWSAASTFGLLAAEHAMTRTGAEAAART